jgi:hypothetical protein
MSLSRRGGILGAACLLMALPGTGFGGDDTPDASRAIAAFEQSCLASAPGIGDWKSTFKAAGIASLNRNKLGMPTRFPAGDAIVDPKIVDRNIGAPVVADCAVVLAGNHGKEAAQSIKSFLSSRQFPLKTKSDMTYAAQTKREKVVYQKAFRVNERNFHVLVTTKDTEEFGLLTVMNASLIDDVKN